MEDKYPNRIFNYHEEQNPYNSSFTDLFIPVTDRMNGYENIYDPDSESIFSRDEYDLTAFFACVSYSKEDFVVFISSSTASTSAKASFIPLISARVLSDVAACFKRPS